MRAEAGKVARTGVVARAAVIGAAYGVVAYLCLSFTRFGAPVESIWLSNALLVGALLRTPRRGWPTVVICAAIGHLLAHLSTGDAPAFSIAFLAGDMSESVLCAALLLWRPWTLAFQNRGAILYFFAACAACALTSAVIALGAATIFAGSALGVEDFAIWFAADALALIIFAPLFYGFSKERWRKVLTRPFTIAVIVGGIVLVNEIATLDPRLTPVRFLVLPLLVWGAFDLGMAGVEVGLAALLAVWVGFALSGRPPTPWVNLDMRGDLVVAQLLLTALAMTILPLAVVLEERQRLNKTLSDCLKETQEAWGAVIGAEARYRLVVDHVSEMVMRVDRDGVIQFASPECAVLPHTGDLQGQVFFELMHPDDAAEARARFDECLRHALTNLAHRWRWRLGQRGNWQPVDMRVTLISPTVGREEFVVVLSTAGGSHQPHNQ